MAGPTLNRARAQDIMHASELDGLLGASFENVYYLSGLWAENFFILPHQTQVYALVSAADLERPRIVSGLGEAANIFDMCPRGTSAYLYGRFFRAVTDERPLDDLERFVKEHVVDAKPFGSAVDATVAAVEDAGLSRGRITYDERSMFPHNVAALQQRLPNVTWVPGWDIFRRIRAVKTADEVRRLRAAVQLTEQAISAAMHIARPGVTEQDMVEEFDRTVVCGSGKPLFAQIAFGRRGGHGNVMRRTAKLEHDTLIRFDVGCMVEGYTSDIARNFALEEPSARTRSLYDAVLHGEDVAIAALRPGVVAAEVFEAGVRAIRQAGIPEYNRHHIGHAVGLEVYDTPTLMPEDRTPIELGMVFEVETPYYELGFGGLQPEDTVLVTEQGGELLTTLSRQLEVWS
jgi:Xaa-Pro aminopeptidase